MRATVALLLLVLTACAGNTAGTDEAQRRLVVENRSSLDMDIYAIQEAGSPRVGFAPAGETTSFQLVPGMITGSGGIQFEARPARGAGRAVRSEPFFVGLGDEVTWSIPPQ